MNRMRARGSCVVLGFFVALGACGKSIDPRLDDSPLDGLDFSYRLAITACDVDFACGHINENDARRCYSYAGTPGPNSLVEAALRRGTVEYIPERAAECLQTMRDTCLTRNIGACQHSFVGRVPPGEPCILGIECENQGRCMGQDESGTNPLCVAGYERGRSCEGVGVLLPCPAPPDEVGLCEEFDGTARCYVAKTPERSGLGEPCGVTEPNDEGEVHLTTCDPHLRCGDGVCSTFLEPGAPCERATDCGPDATCTWEICVPIVVREQAGDSCGYDQAPNPPIFEDCSADGLLCEGGACQELGDGSEGSLCDWLLGPAACREGLSCDNISNICLPTQ